MAEVQPAFRQVLLMVLFPALELGAGTISVATRLAEFAQSLYFRISSTIMMMAA